MTTEDTEHGIEYSNVYLMWVALGRLALQGKVSLRVVRLASAILIAVASHRRHDGNKTYAADELRSSRRVIRELLERWTDGEDIRCLLERLRDELESEAEAHARVEVAGARG